MVTITSLRVTKSTQKLLTSTISKEWSVILLSDGSLTRHLKIWSEVPTRFTIQSVNILKSKLVHEQISCTKIGYPQVNRQIWFITQQNKKIVYASSIWNKRVLEEYLNQQSSPMGIKFIQSEFDIYRYIYKIEYIHCYKLEKFFNCTGPFWARYYFFLHNGYILTSIQEIFSPILCKNSNSN